jgi:hypothetical protein
LLISTWTRTKTYSYDRDGTESLSKTQIKDTWSFDSAGKYTVTDEDGKVVNNTSTWKINSAGRLVIYLPNGEINSTCDISVTASTLTLTFLNVWPTYVEKIGKVEFTH